MSELLKNSKQSIVLSFKLELILVRIWLVAENALSDLCWKVLQYWYSHRPVAGWPLLFPLLRKILFPFQTYFIGIEYFLTVTVKCLSFIFDSSLSFNDCISLETGNCYSGQNVRNTDILLDAGLLRFPDFFWFLLHLYCVQQSLNFKFSNINDLLLPILQPVCE